MFHALYLMISNYDISAEIQLQTPTSVVYFVVAGLTWNIVNRKSNKEASQPASQICSRFVRACVCVCVCWIEFIIIFFITNCFISFIILSFSGLHLISVRNNAKLLLFIIYISSI